MKTWLEQAKTPLQNENVALKGKKTLLPSETVTRKGENALTEPKRLTRFSDCDTFPISVFVLLSYMPAVFVLQVV